MDSISKAKTPSKLLKPVRFCDMVDMPDGFLVPGNLPRSATPKPFRFQPVRVCDMIKELEESAKKSNKVRKQLWSGKKENKRVTTYASKRLSTTMKPEKGVRKSIFNKPTVAKVVSTIKKSYSRDDTLPLLNLENFEENPNKLKKPLNEKIDQKLNPKRLSFKSNIRSTLLVVENKTGSTNKSSIPRKTNHLTPQENKSASNTNKTSRANKSASNTNITPRDNKPQSKTTNETILELFNKKIDELNNKIDLRATEICKRLDKLELAYSKLHCKKCSCPQILISPPVCSEPKNLNNSCYIVENNPNIKLNNSAQGTDSVESMRTPEINDLINKAIINIDLKPKNIFSTIKSEPVVEDTVVILDTPCLEKINNKTINKFELLESKLKYGSPMSDELSLSDMESPVICKDINWLLNDKDEGKLHKSLSTPSVPSTSTKKSVTFKFKSQTDLRDPVSVYNDMRTCHTFLCTPKKTKNVSNLMTPSVNNNQKKILSRQIQKQLLMLD